MTSLVYLFLPLLAIYLLFKKLGANSFLIGLMVAAYFVPVSIVKITVPLFDDRIASWSTFSDQEVWDYAISMSIPSMGLLACLIVAALGIFNKEPSLIQHNDLLDEKKDEDNLH
jgi:predicted histidine transporter YuiF (NhaC family)